MKIRRTIRSRWLVTALALGAVAFPAAAQAGGTVADGRSPDTRDSAAAAQLARYGPPDGWYTYARSLTVSDSVGSLVDGRSPDTKDFAQAAKSQSVISGLPDLRSPDTRDAAILAHSPVQTVVRSSGFHWGDAGIGLGVGMAMFLLLGSLIESRRRRQPTRMVTA